MMYEDKNKDESLCHAALLYSKKIGIGTPSSNERLRELLESHGSFEGIYHHFFMDNLEAVIKSTPGLENVVAKLNRVGFDFKLLTINDIDFPEQLKKEKNATPAIYTRGHIKLFNTKSMAVVGTRHIYPKKDRQAYEEANNLLKRLVNAGYMIVSGLAEGCDTIAHNLAISNKGNTIAVLGTPLDQSYPYSNKSLQEKIAREHLLVSQYPIGIRTFESYFANRNLTTVSLATDGIAVVKASDHSGTMHAVEACYKQDKPIYVLENNYSKSHEWLEIFKSKIKKVSKT